MSKDILPKDLMSKDIKISDLLEKSQSELTDSEVTEIAQELILKSPWAHHSSHSPSQLKKSAIKIHSNLYQDLEIFTSYTHQPEDTIFNQINKTQTILGDFYLKELLLNPTRNIGLLSQRQHNVQNLLHDMTKFQKIHHLLSQLKKLEKGGLWIWKPMTPEFGELYNQVYFQNFYLQSFNQSEFFLKIYNYFQIIFVPIYGLLSPILFFIIPYLIVRFFYGVNLPFNFYFNILKTVFWGSGGGIGSLLGGKPPTFVVWGQYFSKIISIGFYIYNIYNSFYASYTLNNIINLIHKKVNQLAKFIKIAYQLYQEVKPLLNLDPLTVSHLELWDPIFGQEPSLLSNKGQILRTYYMVLNHKEKLLPLIQSIGLIDSQVSIASLFVQGSYSYPVYLNNPKPLLVVNQLWNPFLDPETTVKNNIQLGDGLLPRFFKPNNVIITGPNASGKSTFIKSLVLSVLMAQSLGISSSSKLSLTPFQFLNTYLNIPDAKGRESLFEAEMNRSRQHIDDVKALREPGTYSLVVMDEIFNSTNYEEGVAGAYIVAKELGQTENSLAIVTTHFPYLTKLSKTGDFLNYKFEVEKNDSILKPTYRLKSGISKQYLALDMLEKKGYPAETIQEARKIFKELVEMTQPKMKKRKSTEFKKIPRSESIRLEIKPQLERNKNKSKSKTKVVLEQKIGKNLDLVCVIEDEYKKEEILKKIQKAVEEKVSKDLQPDS